MVLGHLPQIRPAMQRTFFACLLFALLGLGVICQGAETSAPTASSPYVETQRPHSRFWLFFNTPAQNAPDTQFAYAQSLAEQGQLRSASRQFRRLARYWPTAPQAPLAQLEYAQLLEKRGKLYDAFDAYKELLEKFNRGYQYEEILSRMFNIADTVLHKKKGRFLFFPGFAAPERAVPLFEAIVKLGPEWGKAPEAQFLVGEAHELNKDYDEAIAAYTMTMYRYPNSPFAEIACFNRTHDLYLIAINNPNDDAAADAAWSSISYFLSSFPASEYRNQAKDLRGLIAQLRAKKAYDQAFFYDYHTRHKDSAILAYHRFLQEFPHSDLAPKVEQRLKEIAPGGANNAKP